MNDIDDGIQDSTSNSRDGIEIEDPSYRKDGILGKSAIDFDGVNDGFNIPNNFGLYQHDFTIECWAKFDSYPTSKQTQLIFLGGEICAHLCYRTKSDAIDWEVRYTGEHYWDSIHIVNNPSDISNFHYYAATAEHNIIDKAFYDGSFIGSQDNDNIDTHIYSNIIGFRPSDNSCYFDGLMEEIRISNIARGFEWVTTSYNTMNNSPSFLSFGSQVTSS
jgi:hypothetical protein